jgi:hypothetical protein
MTLWDLARTGGGTSSRGRLMRSLLALASAAPGVETFKGLVAILFGVAVSSGLLLDGADLLLSLLPLVFVAYGVIHIAVFTDIRNETEERK